MSEPLFVRTIYVASDRKQIGSCAHRWTNFSFQSMVHQLWVEESPNSHGVLERKTRKEGV